MPPRSAVVLHGLQTVDLDAAVFYQLKSQAQVKGH